jgi:hypothetical protein
MFEIREAATDAEWLAALRDHVGTPEKARSAAAQLVSAIKTR